MNLAIKSSALCALVVLGFARVSMAQEPPATPVREDVVLHMQRGDFSVAHFGPQLPPGAKAPKAIIIFGSGGGGWCGWEEKFARRLQSDGNEVIGIDFAPYSSSNYTLENLQLDYQTMAQFAMKPYGATPPPLILAGWSTGAEQAVAVAGGPHPPTGLVGVLLISAGSWGGYGWYAANNIGPRIFKTNTFLLTDFSAQLNHLRIAQWHGAYDFLDSRDLLKSLKGPHREFVFPGGGHDFGDCSEEFRSHIEESILWILGQEPGAVIAPTPTPTQ